MEDVFVANGYNRKVIKKFMKDELGDKEVDEQQYRGVVIVPYARGISEQFKRLASKQRFRTAFKPGKKI